MATANLGQGPGVCKEVPQSALLTLTLQSHQALGQEVS